MRIPVCAAIAAAVGAASLVVSRPAPAVGERLLPEGSPYLLPKISRMRAETRRWQRLMGKPRTPSGFSARVSRNADYRRWVLRLWTKRAIRARRAARRPPHLRRWLCIYRHERHPRQRWRTRTGNGFYGGLQMSISFQRRYAPWLLRQKGTADRWTPLEQLWVAERGRRAQGWSAWPNTSRWCGARA